MGKRTVAQWWLNLPGYPPRDEYPELDREHVIYYPADLRAIERDNALRLMPRLGR